MSKSVGNFIVLNEAIRGQRSMVVNNAVKQIGWTADATRFALCDGGDGLEDANFSCDVAEGAVMRLFSEMSFAEEVVGMPEAAPGEEEEEANTFAARVLMARVNRCVAESDASYAAMRYREVLVSGFFLMQDARDAYRKSTKKMSRRLMLVYVETLAKLIAPICPHYAENVWRNILSRPGSVFDSGFPLAFSAAMGKKEQDEALKKSDYVGRLERKLRLTMERMKKPGSPRVSLFVATAVPPYHQFVVDFLKSNYPSPLPAQQKEAMGKVTLALKSTSDEAVKSEMKRAMKLAPSVFQAAAEEGPEAYETTLAFDEAAFLASQVEYLKDAVKCLAVEIRSAAELPSDYNGADPTPGVPGIVMSF